MVGFVIIVLLSKMRLVWEVVKVCMFLVLILFVLKIIFRLIGLVVGFWISLRVFDELGVNMLFLGMRCISVCVLYLLCVLFFIWWFGNELCMFFWVLVIILIIFKVNVVIVVEVSMV